MLPVVVRHTAGPSQVPCLISTLVHGTSSEPGPLMDTAPVPITAADAPAGSASNPSVKAADAKAATQRRNLLNTIRDGLKGKLDLSHFSLVRSRN